ncbi:MAG: cation:proton antiporter [Treponema sp.]|nr:cation:proton antiporter [Treponema sp.]
MEDPFAHLLPQILHFNGIQATQLVLLLGIIMFIGAVGGWLFQKLKIPQVVGYIVMGIIIGSSGFHVLEPEVIKALDPVSTVALSLIGFLVGGELKLGTVKKYGKQFVSILLFEAITPAIVVGLMTGLVCFLVTKDVRQSVSLALILGAICSATAPAATTDVLAEYRTRGPLTTTVYGIVAMDDAVALILYTIASTIAHPLIGGQSLPFWIQLLNIFRDIFGSIAVGALVGFLLSLITRLLTNEGRILTFALGCLFLSTGITQIFDLDNILAAMSLGFFMVNFAPQKTRGVFTLVDKFTPPVYVLFFVLVGAKLNIWIITPFLGILALLYVAGRTIGKSIGASFGAWLTHAPKTVQKFLPFCLLSQAGVAIGLSIAAGNDFPDSIGPQILLIITATTFIVQLIGPICVKVGVTKAGECGLNVTVEDIKKNSRVTDVTWGKEHICSDNSPAIVCETDRLFSILNSFSRNQNLNYVVKSASDGTLVGIISLEHLKEVMQIGDFAESMLAMDVMDQPIITCKPSTLLPEAYKLFEEKDIDAIPIVDADNTPLGILEKQTVDHYLHTRIIELNRKLEELDI